MTYIYNREEFSIDFLFLFMFYTTPKFPLFFVV